MQTCTVYVRAKDGHFILGHVTAANSVFDAARNGLASFEDASHGKAHPQSDDTILEVRPVCDYAHVHYVRVGTISELPDVAGVGRYGTRLPGEVSAA
jgi:hypothetical protein